MCSILLPPWCYLIICRLAALFPVVKIVCICVLILISFHMLCLINLIVSVYLFFKNPLFLYVPSFNRRYFSSQVVVNKNLFLTCLVKWKIIYLINVMCLSLIQDVYHFTRCTKDWLPDWTGADERWTPNKPLFSWTVKR